MKLDRIVIGTDFSDASIAAAQWGVRRFAPGAEVVLVHALTVPQSPHFLRGRFPPPPATLIATAQAGAEARLYELSSSIDAERVWLETRIGRPWHVLGEVAAAYDADAVVVGRHGVRPGVWGRLGSTAEMLVRTSEVPVLLATGLHDAKLRHVVAAVDDSDVAPTVAAWARHFAVRDAVRVTALHVVTSAVLRGVLARAGAAVGGSDEDEETRNVVRHDADRWVEGLIGPGASADRVASEIAFGEAGEEILAAAERHDCDLIVVGGHSAGVLTRLVVGGVAADVLRGAECPVLVVKPPEDELVD